MSRQKRSADKGLRQTATVTKFGIALLASGTLLLSIGLLNGELTAILSGATLFLFAAFSLSIVFASALVWRSILITAERTGIDNIMLRISPPAASPKLALTLFLCDIRYTVRYSLDSSGTDESPHFLSVPVRRTEGKQAIATPGRGFYYGSVPSLRISDFSGLFCFERPIPDAARAETLIIPAKPEPCALPSFPPGRAGHFTGKSTFRRSEDLYESRQYIPGDDPRKMNWKVFAHTGDLAIREGELLPPPSSEYIFIINSNLAPSCGGESRKAAERRFETIVSRAAFLALWLSDNRRIVSIITGNGTANRTRVIPGSDTSEKAILEAFSRCSLRVASTFPEILSPDGISAGKPAIIVITMPDQPLSPFPGQTEALFLLGPVPQKADPWSPKKELLRYVFLDTAAKSDTTNQAYHNRFSAAFLGLKKDEINVQGI